MRSSLCLSILLLGCSQDLDGKGNNPDGVADEIGCTIVKSCCAESIGHFACLWCTCIPLMNCFCCAMNPEGYFWQVTGTCDETCDGCPTSCFPSGQGDFRTRRRELEAQNSHNISLAFNDKFLCFKRAKRGEIYRP